MKLLPCISQTQNKIPYRFPLTGTHVYSLEEALYHVYHYWKQSMDDVVNPFFASWVGEKLGLAFVASKISEIAKIDQFSERMLAFLALIEYFSEQELNALRPELEQWEKRQEWETYKERADSLVNSGRPDKAIALYQRAIKYEENVPLLNNLGVAYMQIEKYTEASQYLGKARKLDAGNWELALNHAEALILAKRFDDAADAIQFAAKSTNEAKAVILYLKGELALRMGQYAEAIPYFEAAIKIEEEKQYVFRLIDTYTRMRQYDKALQTLNKYALHSVDYLIKEAEIYEQSNNIEEAIASIQSAIKLKSGLPDLWVLLAKYYRLNSNLISAEKAINKATALDSNNGRVQLENARIMKRLGKTKAYQLLLKDMLIELKHQYREAHLND